jgi:ABC-type antimicrobial peptide transport system permease subunit
MKPTFRAGSFPPDPERDVKEEIEAHIEMEAEALMAKGVPEAAARDEARRLFGDRKRFQEEARKDASARERGVRWQDRFDAFSRDVRFAFRRMAKSPGFTSIAILSLALGIGANTAIFSLVNSILLSGVPMRAPQELVEVYTSEEGTPEEPGYPYSVSTYPDLVDLREQTDVFSGVAGYEAFFSRLETETTTEPIWGEAVSWDLFSVLGIEPEAGRFFVSEEGQTPGTHPVSVLGYDFWQKRFGGDPSIVGQSIRLGGRQYTVVGVAPKEVQGFTAPGLNMDMFVPMMMSDVLNFEGSSDHLTQRTSRSTFIKARLAPGVSVEQARAALATLSSRQREAYPEAWEGRDFNLLPTSEVAIHPLVDGPVTGVAALLLTVVGLVLLVACTNLAGFLLARASDRKKEIALRLAMGATRWALIRQLLTETVVLGVLGGLAGLLVANWVLQALMAFQPPIPIPINLDVGLDGTVLLFTLGVAAAAGLFFGLVPALQSTKPDLAPTLKDESRGASGRQKRFSLRNGLVVTQVAISMVLLMEGGIVWLMAFGNDMQPEEFADFSRTVQERARAIPGVEKVASAEMVPLGISFQTGNWDIPGVEPPSGEDHHEIAYNTVSNTYFDVMGIPTVSGRSFGPEDRSGSELVAVISETAAREYWPGESPVGREIVRPGNERNYRIVGVARDTKVWTLGEEYRSYIYLSLEQSEEATAHVVATGTIPESQIVAELQRIAREVDSRVIVMESKTVSDHLSIALFPPRMAALLLGVFGGLALILACTGLYGTVAFSVSRRTREMGIRLSLGAEAGKVVSMVLRGAMSLVIVGTVIGVVLSLGLAQAIQGFLYGVGALDPVTFLGVPMILVGVALVAALVPARRASRVDPVQALKSE